MAEVCIDIPDQRPKVLTTDAVEASDVVITMGCGDACPIFPGKRYLDWALKDPAGDALTPPGPLGTRSRAGGHPRRRAGGVLGALTLVPAPLPRRVHQQRRTAAAAPPDIHPRATVLAAGFHRLSRAAGRVFPSRHAGVALRGRLCT